MKNIKQWITPLAASAVVVSTLCLPAQDWPQWRGVNRDGKTGAFAVPSIWPTNLTQKWKLTVGKGDSSPVLVGNNLYVFARQEADEELFCLDAATGNVRWKSAYPANYVVTGPAASHPGPRSSPVIAGGKVCTLGVAGILSCFDASTGAILWQKQSTNDYLGIQYKTESAMSPIVEDGRCIVQVGPSTNGAIIAFDLATGEPKWKMIVLQQPFCNSFDLTTGEPKYKLEGEGPANSSPVIMTAGGKKQLVIFTTRKLVGLDLSDGKLLWQVPFEATQGNNATPVINGTTVIYAGQGKGMLAVNIQQQGGAFTATALWSDPQFGGRYTSPILKDGFLYGSYGANGGRLFCVNAQTGEAVWDQVAGVGDTATLVDAGPVMFALGARGQLIAFKPGTLQYTQLARYTVAATETWAHPVVAGNRIFVKDNESIALWTLEPIPAQL
jgi:outer membrane protein assembly factor BamB